MCMPQIFLHITKLFFTQSWIVKTVAYSMYNKKVKSTNNLSLRTLNFILFLIGLYRTGWFNFCDNLNLAYAS